MICLEADTFEELEDAELFENEYNRLPSPGVKAGKVITTPPGSPGWTMRVHRIRRNRDGKWRVRISDRLAALIAHARSIPREERTIRQRRLARLPVPRDVLREILDDEEPTTLGSVGRQKQ